MSKIVLSFCVLFLTASSLHSSSNELAKQPTCVISEEAPCSFVNDTVNVVGGNFYLQMHHLNVPGHVPLDLVQYYNSKSDYSSWFGTGMSLNYSFWMQGPIGGIKKGDKHDKYEKIFAESSGGSIIACLGKPKYASGTYKFYIDPEVIHEQFTNCGSGQISGRTNLKNLVVKEKLKLGKYLRLTAYLPDGSIRKHYRTYREGAAMNVLWEKRPNTTRLDFHYYKYHEKEEGS